MRIIWPRKKALYVFGSVNVVSTNFIATTIRARVVFGSLQHKVSKSTFQNQMQHGKTQWLHC